MWHELQKLDKSTACETATRLAQQPGTFMTQLMTSHWRQSHAPNHKFEDLEIDQKCNGGLSMDFIVSTSVAFICLIVFRILHRQPCERSSWSSWKASSTKKRLATDIRMARHGKSSTTNWWTYIPKRVLPSSVTIKAGEDASLSRWLSRQRSLLLKTNKLLVPERWELLETLGITGCICRERRKTGKQLAQWQAQPVGETSRV